MVKWSKVRWEGHFAHGTRILLKKLKKENNWETWKTIFESYSKLIIVGRFHLFPDTCRWLALTDPVMNSCGNDIDQLSDYQLTKHDYAPRNFLPLLSPFG